jgi:hypothetical protein
MSRPRRQPRKPSRRRAIPDEYVPAILELAGQRKGTREIAAWLAATHGVKVAHVTVGKLLRELRDERAVNTQLVAQETLAPVVTSDLQELDEIRKRARAIEDAARPDPTKTGREAKGNPFLMLKAQEMQRKVLDTRLHYAGADGGGDAARTLAELTALAFEGKA